MQAQQMPQLSQDGIKDLAKKCKAIRDRADHEVYQDKQAGFQEWLSQSLRGGGQVGSSTHHHMGPPRGHTSPRAGRGRGPTMGPLGGSEDQADS
eukprot:1634195-Pyramimonas_sp.AAC.1